MKKFAVLAVAAAAMVLGGGCTPAYDAKENTLRVARTWGYDAREAQEDTEHLLMLTPASRMTTWNARVPD